jgi:Domain of unknown function (DUF3330)
MATTAKPTDATLVSCETCLKQVPASEAIVSEASDYFVHFCGLECYEKWKNQPESPKPQDYKPSP